jgi:hypothetical protein
MLHPANLLILFSGLIDNFIPFIGHKFFENISLRMDSTFI